MTDIIRIGLDRSKSLFQLHGVNAAEQPVLRKQLRRGEMIKFFEKLPPVVVVLEAYGASHHWARLLSSFGHEVGWEELPAPATSCCGVRSCQERLP